MEIRDHLENSPLVVQKLGHLILESAASKHCNQELWCHENKHGRKYTNMDVRYQSLLNISNMKSNRNKGELENILSFNLCLLEATLGLLTLNEVTK